MEELVLRGYLVGLEEVVSVALVLCESGWLSVHLKQTGFVAGLRSDEM